MTDQIKRISHQRHLADGGPRLPLQTKNLGDGKWEASVVGQEHMLKATGTSDTEAVRELRKIIHEKFTSGDLGDLKQRMI